MTVKPIPDSYHWYIATHVEDITSEEAERRIEAMNTK